MAYCNYCEAACDTTEIDEGNYEDYGSTKVWRPVLSDVCTECGNSDLVEFSGYSAGQMEEMIEYIHDIDYP